MAQQTAAEQQTERIINGVDLHGLRNTIRAIQDKPELADFKFRAKSHWIEGGLNRTTIDDFYGTCQTLHHKKPFINDADEPSVLLGKDRGTNPVEYLLNALLSCMTTSTAYHAAAKGIHIEAIETEVEGDIDLHGFLGLSEDVRKGYQELRVKMMIKSNGPAEAIRELYKMSPVYDVVSKSVPIKVDVEVEPSR